MSTLTKYYKNNQDENPYKMESAKESSRVEFLKYYIKQATEGIERARILDVGSGDGYLHRELPQYAWTGLDVSTAFLGGLNTVLQHDLESFPYPVEPGFDVVVCSETLEHLFSPVEVTKEIYRLLKPGGTYILSTPNFDFIDHYISGFREVRFDVRKSWTKEHIHWYTVDSHAEILSLAGFKNYEVMGSDPQYGLFFQEARSVLYTWLLNNFSNSEKEAQINADMLLSNMFKKHLHTIVMVTKKPC